MSVEKLVETIADEAKNYPLSDEVRQVLGDTVLVSTIGPFLTGKTTAMLQAEKKASDFSIVHGFTTRPGRPWEPDDVYRLLPHTEESLEGILDSLRDGQLVQIAVHPSTGYVYGSDARDYKNRYSMLATLASVMEGLRSIPFGGVKEIAMATLPPDWWGRVNEFAKVVGAEEIRKRLSEGIFSLEWSLDQDDKIPWVINDNGHLDEAVDNIIGIARGEQGANPHNRWVGEVLLKSIKERRSLWAAA
ncbi:MAG TPA: hypothetical protein VMR18_04220 [Candidatus Saccharimonadales bacterium]|nr:hypothetical protein [Candidatus Saccharimonadales bacterium]